ncbi:MAG: PorP/SprF family type IX secretion system membrane protein [Chitinophagaceae bacterium]|nr:PorP/SprF family type IX secretion system membrane protein [Chitinophagaceae bacterium]MCB9045440.1 PorP/SprF family type IX secretion system membrane protein [Chitinophagales bacterium]
MQAKRYYTYLIIIAVLLLAQYRTFAQGLHFSQYYNAPMLLSPANTALMSDADFRLGTNYRTQWSTVPVPFNTFSAYADFQLLRNRNLTNWLGLGLAMFNDKAGDGQLALSRYEGFAAYHIQTGNYSMFSVGFSGAYVQRSVDFSKLTFDMQWDGFKFDATQSNGESGYIAQTNYVDIGAGVNYAYYPSEFTYIKLGVSAAHINQPKESFYNQDNKLQIRPSAYLDAIFITSETFTLNPSVYYSMQSTSQELVYGLQAKAYITEDNLGNPTNVIFGAYHRLNDAIVPVLGFEWSGVKFITSYDLTLSDIAPDVKYNGALEFSLIYQGMYTQGRDKMNCPRF